jgi:hypothetical protein
MNMFKYAFMLLAAGMLLPIVSSQAFAWGGMSDQRTMFPNSPALGQIHSADPNAGYNNNQPAYYGPNVTNIYYQSGVGPVRVNAGTNNPGVYRSW